MYVAMQNDPPNLELLIKIMKMTTSSTDGEALAAIRMANAALQKSGGDWETLLRGKLAPIDPFATLPEPPRAAPKPTYSASPPPPPPPPVYFGLDAKEAKDIAGWLVIVEFATLDSYTTRQMSHIETRWRTNKRLDRADYDLLKRTATQAKRKR